MKIYRVAETKKKKEGAYKEVDSIDLSKETNSWTSKKQIEEINITEEGYERQALIRIVFDEKDIIALYEGLVKGWQKELSNYEEANYELSNDLINHKRFFTRLQGQIRLNLIFENSPKNKERLEKLLSSMERFEKINK